MKEGTKVEKKDVESSNENKNELKLKGDSGYNYNYCNGHNHLEKDCMLRKKEIVTNEVYYVEKLEEIRSQMKNIPLVARGNDDNGTYQIWSVKKFDIKLMVQCMQSLRRAILSQTRRMKKKGFLGNALCRKMQPSHQ